MPYRVSFQFNIGSARLGGWSENFWNSGNDIATVRTRAANLWPLLVACHGAQAFSPRFRVANALANRDSQLFSDPTAAARPVDANNPDGDFPTTSLQISMRRADGSGTHMWMKGLQDEIIVQGGRYIAAGVFAVKFPQLVGMLENVNNGWSLYKLDNAEPKMPITSVSTAGVVVCPAHGFTPPNKIRISRVKNVPGVNKIWKFTVLSADSIQLLNWTPYTGTVYDFGDGVAQEQVYLTSQVNEVQVVQATKHNIGRPLNAFIGRRKAR